MATTKSTSPQLKGVISMLILALAITFAASARILEEEIVAPVVAPDPDEPVEAPVAPTTGVGASTEGPDDDEPVEAPVPGVTPGSGVVPPGAVGNVSPAAGAGAGAGAGVANGEHPMTFFMHDILGGSNPTAIAVTGIVANPAASGQVAFAKPNGAILPVENGVQSNEQNGAVLNNNNVPFLTGLSGFPSGQSNGNGNTIIGGGFGMPAINLAQFPTGTTLQKLMFGTMTVFDDELTEGHEMGSGKVGKAQGYYVFSSMDGTSQTMAFNVLFHDSGYADSICLFGVHRPADSESHLAIMGGTGKYVNAKGFATVKAFPASAQHQTDGMETVLRITLYLAY